METNTSETVAGTSQRSSSKRGFQATGSFTSLHKLKTEFYSEEWNATAHLYDPHSYRTIDNPITDVETGIHLLKGSIAAGILAMPRAFYFAGIVPGIVGTALIGSLCVYALSTLIKMQYIQCQRLRTAFLVYPLSLKIALRNGPKCLRPLACVAPCVVDGFLIGVQIGTCTAYVIFMGESIKNAVEPHFINDLRIEYYLLALFLPVVLINCIRDLKHLSPVSLAANMLIIVAFSCCFYYIFFVGPWRNDTCNMVSSVKTWPLFIGTALFAIEGVGVIIALEHNMENPKHFLGCKGIFPWCMVIVVSFYAFVGFIGYFKYGDEVKGTIVASLPQHEWLSTSIGAVYAGCIYGTYPLQMYVAYEILWFNYINPAVKNYKSECCIEYLMRTVCVVITFVLAILIPHIDIVISLVGALTLSCLGITFPFIIEMCTLYPDRLSWFTLLKDLIFIIFGFCIFVLGTYVSLYTLISS